MISLVRNKTAPIALMVISITIGMLVYNKVFNIHTHVLPNGTIITHAHPYNKIPGSSPLQTHQHTLGEICNLESTDLFYISLILLAGIVLFSKSLKYYQKGAKHNYFSQFSVIHYRGPPYI